MPRADRRRVSVLDLTGAQVEELEAELGMPVTRWQAAPSAVRVLVAVLSAASGRPRSEFLALTLRELADRVSLSGEEPDAEEGSDPEATGEPS